jgi:hypothetical protein
MRGSRDGDIGCERVPVSEFFQLHTEQCRDDVYSIATNTFTLRDNKTTIAGVAPAGSKLFLGDAADWNSPDALLSSTNSMTPVLVGQVALPADQPVYLRVAAVVGRRRDGTAGLSRCQQKSICRYEQPAGFGLFGIGFAESFCRS